MLERETWNGSRRVIQLRSSPARMRPLPGARGRKLQGTVHRVIRGYKIDRFRRKVSRDHSKDRVVVQGVNLIIKHQRRTGDVRTQVGRIEREAPIHISNVMLVCPSCKEATRVGFRVFEDGSKSPVLQAL